MNKIQSLLHELIPDDIAEKGLSKIDPKIKKFISNSVKAGLGAAGAVSFLRSIIGKKPQQQSDTMRPDERANATQLQENERRSNALKSGIGTLAAGTALGGLGNLGRLGNAALGAIGNVISSKQRGDEKNASSGTAPISPSSSVSPRDILAKHDPKLANYVEGHISKGRSPLEAGALAIATKKFTKPISKIEREHKTPFVDLLTNIYGQGGQNVQDIGQQPMQPQQNQQPNVREDILNRIAQANQILDQLQGMR